MKSIAAFAGVLCLSAVLRAADEKPPRIDVILWFDTEDYLLPASDDSARRLAEMLSARGIHATFKVVGEKARTLERRRRTDVINALKKHTIGFHADFHSVHPTPTEYLAECGLLDGIAEFVRREGDGAADVRRIFGVKTLACYGQPGSSWAAQAVAGLKEIGVAPHGVPCYVDEGTHVGLNEKPFWYAGTLNIYHMGGNYTRMELHSEDAVQPAKEKVSAIAARLARDHGGIISIFYHPCEWVHQQFWDGVNFARGANPPREEWKAPPQRTAAETEGAFRRFGEYIDHIRGIPGVRFVTAADLPDIYPDQLRTEGATAEEMTQLSQRIREGKELDYQVLGSKAFSPADQFELFAVAVANIVAGEKVKLPVPSHGLLGPDGAPPSPAGAFEVPAPAFRDAVLDVADFVKMRRRVPARVYIGADAVAPADFLVALASAYGGSPAAARVGTGAEVLTTRYVARDTPGLFGGWVIHKEGFRAPKVVEVARLQAWTLKPAVRK